MFGSFFKKIKQNAAQESSGDPVCGMRAREGIMHTYNGKTFAFCSEHCKEQFVKNPQAYVAK